MLHQWASLGEYDFVNIVEAPDDLTVARVSLALGRAGRRSSSRCRSSAIDEVLSVIRVGTRSRAGAASAGSRGVPG